jgi:hypothetical protein
MASDTMRVYWTEFGDALGSSNGSVKGCPLAGCGGRPTVYGQALINPRGVVSDGKYVYWGTATYSSVPGGIWACAVAGCPSPTHLAGASIPWGMAVDATYVYWVDNDLGTVHRVNKTTAMATVLYDGGVYDDAGDNIRLPEQLAADTTSLFFTDDFATVFRLPIGGGNPVQVAPGTHGGGWPVAVDSTWVYFGQDGNILRAAKTATSGGTTIANVIDPVGLAVDPAVSGLVYWADWGSGNGNDGTVGKVTSDGKTKTILASSQTSPEAVTVSGPYVFWISNGTLPAPPAVDTLPGTGKLFRAAK